MEKEQKGKTRSLPPIREGKDVGKNEPRIIVAGKVASLPIPIPHIEKAEDK